MNIGTTGIIFNEFTQILLMQRDDTRTWAPPGGALEAGELPTEGVAREVREETGLIVYPVRLVGLYFMPGKERGSLIFSFRCIQRGGEIQTSIESPQVGWFPTRPFPRRVLGFHRQRIQEAFHHQGGPPIWRTRQRTWLERAAWFLLRQIVYRFKDWRIARRGLPPYQPPPSWETAAFVVIRNDAGQVLWVKRAGQDEWELPGGGGFANEAPWETAVRETFDETGLRVTLTHLSGVYVYEGDSQLVFTFIAEAQGGSLIPGAEAAEFAYFAPGAEPPNCVPQHLERLQDALAPGDVTQFKKQTPLVLGDS